MINWKRNVQFFVTQSTAAWIQTWHNKKKSTLKHILKQHRKYIIIFYATRKKKLKKFVD